MERIDELITHYEKQAQAYWDFMTQKEKEEHAWLAGVIDSEGNIRATKRWNRHTKNLEYHLWLQIATSDKATAETIRRIAGIGQIYFERKRPNRRQMYRWICWDRRAASILRRCLPYLVTKRAQAVLGLEFIAAKCFPGQRPTPGEIAKRERLIQAIKCLNNPQKG